MDQKERLRAEKLLNKLTPYIEVKDYGALLCAIHNQIEYQHKQLKLNLSSLHVKEKYKKDFEQWIEDEKLRWWGVNVYIYKGQKCSKNQLFDKWLKDVKSQL